MKIRWIFVLALLCNNVLADAQGASFSHLTDLLNIGEKYERFHTQVEFRLYRDPGAIELVEQMRNEVWRQGDLYLSRDADRDLLMTADQIVVVDHGAKLVMVNDRRDEPISFPDLSSIQDLPSVGAIIRVVDGGYEVDYPSGPIRRAEYVLSHSGAHISKVTMIYRESDEWAELATNPRIDVEYKLFDTESEIPKRMFSTQPYIQSEQGQLLPGQRVPGYRVIDQTGTRGS